ncbi:hypothetical protein Droror1_Dr00006437 [Drosera rotundifolia]
MQTPYSSTTAQAAARGPSNTSPVVVHDSVKTTLKLAICVEIVKGLPKEAVSSSRNNSKEASRASNTKGTKNLEDAEVTNPVGRSMVWRLILDPTAKWRILEELLSEVKDMHTPAGMMDVGRTGDEAGAGFPRNAFGVQPKVALEAAVTSQDGVEQSSICCLFRQEDAVVGS